MDTAKANLLDAAKVVTSVFGMTGERAQVAAMRSLHKAIEACEKPRTKKEELYFTLAKDRVIEGDIEVDDDAVVSISDDDGAYVQAWMWVE
ncbi:MAG: hypothetical protein ACRDHZ_24975 [Ktedonobacteraceae bacterium]